MIARLVVNRRSRRGRAYEKIVREELSKSGVACIEGKLPADARIDCIVAVGGDGTFVSLIGEALAANVPLGLIPVGTFNELARTLEISFDVRQACETIARGNTRTIDVGLVNGRYFVNEASIGISSRIARRQTPEIKQRFGHLSVIWTTLVSLARVRRMRVGIAFDDRRVERLRAVQVTVANSHRFGGIFAMDDAAIDDGFLDCYVVETDNLLRALGVVWTTIALRRPVSGMLAYRATRFQVSSRRRHRITADGEPAGKTPAVFEILPRALRTIVP